MPQRDWTFSRTCLGGSYTLFWPSLGGGHTFLTTFSGTLYTFPWEISYFRDGSHLLERSYFFEHTHRKKSFFFLLFLWSKTTQITQLCFFMSPVQMFLQILWKGWLKMFKQRYPKFRTFQWEVVWFTKRAYFIFHWFHVHFAKKISEICSKSNSVLNIL